MIRSVIYTSSAAPGFTRDELARVIGASRRNNASRDLTGMLLFEEGNFLQVLEGPEAALRETMTRIEADQRHRHLDMLFDEASPRRYFPDWAMASRELDGEGALRLSEREFDARFTADPPPIVRVLLRTFLRVNTRFAA